MGKTTVLDTLVKEGFRVENYGDLMLKDAQSRNYVKSRDELRRLPVEKQHEIQKSVAEYLATLQSVIIDTHFSIATNSGYLPGLPHHVLDILNPDIFISVEADPLEVFERRKKDVDRKRDKDTLEKIRMHIEVNRGYGISYSSLTGSPLLVVLNEDGKVAEASTKISSVIRAEEGGK